MLKVTHTPLEDVLVIAPPRFGDNRGFFSESYNKSALEAHGINIEFVQDNHSLSSKVGTVRGLHCQTPPHAQDKLVRCGRGRLMDVAVDIRKGSPTFGRWFAQELSFENGLQLLVPKGFLHGFSTLEPDTEIIYKCSDYYAPECDRAVRFDDPDIGQDSGPDTGPDTGIDWGLPQNINPILSEKDAKAPLLKDFESPFVYEN